jgi:hypothetical protein
LRKSFLYSFVWLSGTEDDERIAVLWTPVVLPSSMRKEFLINDGNTTGDFSVNRDGNDYNWVLQGGRRTGGAARKPSYVQARREPEPEPKKQVTKNNNKGTRK